MRKRHANLSALFLISTTLIAYQLYIMRTFRVGNWSNFGTLVISTALLGFGLSGTLLTLVGERVRRDIDRWLAWSAIAFLPLIALSHIVAQWIPFNPVFLGSNSAQLFWIGAYYVVYGVPFFFAATYIGVSFMAYGDRIHAAYFWNMVGSGLGGFFIIVFMFLLPTDQLILPIVLLAFVAAIFASVIETGPRRALGIHAVRFLAAAVFFVAATLGTLLFGRVRVSEFKPISYVLNYPDTREVHRSQSPAGEYRVFASRLFHFAPGLSDNTVFELDELPSQPFWALYVDGSGPVGVIGALAPQQTRYFEFLPMAAPYELVAQPNVLLVNLAGGLGAQVALNNGATRVDVVEKQRALVRILQQDRRISEFNGNLLRNERLSVTVGEPRAFAAERPNRYDIVEISLIDSVGLANVGGYSVSEDYTYTVEAIDDYMTSLTENGWLSITVWNRLNPPRNVLRLITTIYESLERRGVQQPGAHIAMFDLLNSTATILVKRAPITPREVQRLREFTTRRSFRPAYYPGMARRDLELAPIFRAYERYFVDNVPRESGDYSANDIYHLAMHELVAGRGDRLVDAYIFDIRPITDDRPYYTGFLRFDRLGVYVDQMLDISEEWGYLLVVFLLLQSLIFGALIIALPLATRRRDLFARRRGTLGVIVYFASLGLGYITVEIFLIQRLSFFLGNPTYSVSIVIATMLIMSGIGSLTGTRLAKTRRRIVWIATVGIVASLVLYWLQLTPLIRALNGSPFVVRVLVSILIIAPSAFFLGMPFPTGLNALADHRPRLLPWAFGMNGALSVTGTTLAQVVSVAAGVPLLLLIAGGTYVIVALVFGANERTA